MKRSGPPIVTLTTDFGLSDSYVAEMKGRILAICPAAVLVDVSHQVPPGDVACGAFLLQRAAGAFPAGTVHLAVVDPGVGSDRAALAAATRDGFAVGPDNGLLSPLLDGARLVRLAPQGTGEGEISATFHGRDLFAPAAAMLAGGRPLAELGDAVEKYQTLPESGAAARILHVDHFGNCVTTLAPDDVPPAGGWTVRLGAHAITRRVRTYRDAAAGEAVLLAGSDGRMEIAVRDGSAARLLGAAVGQTLDIEHSSNNPPRRESKR